MVAVGQQRLGQRPFSPSSRRSIAAAPCPWRWFARACAALVLLAALPVAAVQAQDAGRTLRIATFALPPYVMPEGDQLTGFSIDLWTAAAERLKVRSEFQVLPDVAALLKAVESGAADVGVSGVFITAERDRHVDFSVSILEAGLQVMVLDRIGAAAPSPLEQVLQIMISTSFLVWVGIGLLILLIPAHIVWFLDRHKEEGIGAGKGYFAGMYDAMIWAFTALVSQVQQLPRHRAARVLAMVWMFAGVVFVATYTAQLTATLTIEQIHGAINGPSDLPGKRVGTLQASTSAEYLRKRNAQVVEAPDTAAMFKLLRDGEVDAVLFSAPTLLNYAEHEGQGWVRLVGAEFNKGNLGFAVPLGSPLRREINAALLQLREDGTYEAIYAKWFGEQ